MKLPLILLLFGSLLIFSSCDLDEMSQVEPPDQVPNIESLKDSEKEDLLFLLEEEKLARDVYRFSYEKYGLPIFNNISNSEQKHMEAVITLLEKYQINYKPIQAPGTFQDSTLQNLYSTLTQSAKASLLVALQVGANIEELDIRDIQLMVSRTDKTDMLQVFERLSCGSGNHLRAYLSQIKTQGGNYEVQYLSLSEFEKISQGDHEHCGS